MKFKTDKSIDDWVENHRKKGCISNETAGEQFVYEFIPTAIGEVLNVCVVIKILNFGIYKYL